MTSKGDTCCFCFPIQCGLKSLAVYQLVQSGVFLWFMFCILIGGGLNFLGTLLWFIIYAFSVSPVLIGGWYYYKFLTKPSAETKMPLPRAHLFNIVSICIQFAVFTIFGYAYGDEPFQIGGIIKAGASGASVWLSNIITLAVVVSLNFYWMGVTKRVNFV